MEIFITRKYQEGYSEDHPNSHFLNCNGVYMMDTTEISDEFYSLDLVEYAFDKFKTMDPLDHGFLKYILSRLHIILKNKDENDLFTLLQ